MNLVLFDGYCVACSNTVRFLLKHDNGNRLQFIPQQSEAGQRLMASHPLFEDGSSIVFIKGEHTYFRSDAVIEIAKLLSGWPRLFSVGWIIPAGIRNGLYNWIAKNRYTWFGKRTSCYLPSKNV